MDNELFRVIFVVFNDKGKEYAYLCHFEDVNVGDYVIVDGRFSQDLPVRVVRVDMLTQDDLPVPLYEMKEAIAKVVREEETKKINLDEENSDSDEVSDCEIRSSQDPISISVDIRKEFSYIEHHTDLLMKIKDDIRQTQYSFIKKLTLTNLSQSEFTDLQILFEFSNSVLSMDNISISSLLINEEISINIPFLHVNREMLKKIANTEPASLKISICSKRDNLLIASVEHLFKILPISQPSQYIYSDLRLFVKYITPHDSKVKQISLEAFKHNKNRSLIGYQNNDNLDNTLQEINAIYKAIHSYGIVYQNPPVSEQGDDSLYAQRVRMPYEVLTDKKGTCLDLSILFCSVMEEIGFNSILVIIRGHAFVGLFLDEKLGFENFAETRSGLLYNKATGDQNIVFFDPVTVTAEHNTAFNESIKIGINHLRNYSDPLFYAIDVTSSHKGVFASINLEGSSDDLDLDVRPEKLNVEQIDPIIEKKFVNVLRLEEKNRFVFWETKLLDLTEKNPLVNFRFSNSNCVKVISSSPVQDYISKDKPIKLYNFANGIPDDFENFMMKSTAKPSDFSGGEVIKDYLYSVGVEKTLKNLIKKSNSAVEETGAPTLYLCLGVLTYDRKETKKGFEKGHAPFMVLPIKLTKEKMGLFYTLTYDYDDFIINKTFFEYYKQEHDNVDFSDLYNTGANDSYSDIVSTFKKYTSYDIQLDETTCFIATLTFSHYIMWLDMRKRREELKKNSIVKSILENKSTLEDNVKLDTSIEELENYQEFAAPLPYDSTQLRAIINSGKGNSFILDGPPGTGKSQTIVNMIINAFYHGKSVLFIAEKKDALDVVADRLDKLQLDRFCLELHSNKANKTDFFGKLKASMEHGPTMEADEYTSRCTELEEKKRYLRQMINKMHENNKYYFSLYDAIAKLIELEKTDFSTTFSEKYLNNLNNSVFNKTLEEINNFVSVAGYLSDYDSNPLKLIERDDLLFTDKEIVVNDFKQLRRSFENFEKEFKTLCSIIGTSIPSKISSYDSLMKLMGLVVNSEIYHDQLAQYLKQYDITLIENGFMCAKERIILEKDLINVFDTQKLLASNISEPYFAFKKENNFVKRYFAKMKAIKTIKKLFVSSQRFERKKLSFYFESGLNYQKINSIILANNSIISNLIGFDFMSRYLDVANISETFFNTINFLKITKELSGESNYLETINHYVDLYLSKNQKLNIQFSITNESYKDYKLLEEKFYQKYSVNNTILSSKNDSVEYLRLFLHYGSDVNHSREIVDIIALNKITSKLCSMGLDDLVYALRSEKLSYHYFIQAYELSIATSLLRLYFSDENLNYFNPNQFQEEINKYKGLVNDYSNLVIVEVSSRLTRSLNHNNIEYKMSSPIGRLKKSIANNGRGVSIRDTIMNYDGVIRQYFPCFLMSPLSAAQYLSVEEGKNAVAKFDIVIFDEASQIPTHEAIGPIARGKSLIVSGDPEQMPPTSYFSSTLELEGDDIEYEDSDSLLDECLAIGLPRIRLSYHYRSKHESLISFSNENFYKNSLYTFPSSQLSNNFIEFKHVMLKEDKQNSDISEQELDELVTTFKGIYLDPKTSSKSVGIIVFNMKQQEKVERAIFELREKDKKLDEIIEMTEKTTKENIFIKSLENVQGDERDIIILSIGFRKNSNGRASIVGPLTRANGQRRLNVAVTRSKEKMIIISTVKYNDFDEDKNINKMGTKFLKKFLKFAEDNRNQKYDPVFTKPSPIVFSIAKELLELGFDVDTNIGRSEFQVDLAIKNDLKSGYSLGVLVDSRGIADKISTRDRIYVQESVLNGLKWKIINVFALEYYRDKKATINKIVDALTSPYEVEKSPLLPIIEKKDIVFKYETNEYRNYKGLLRTYYTNESGFDSNAQRLIKSIVETEGPVSYDRLRSVVRENSNMQKFSEKANQRLLYLINQLRFVKTHDQNQYFYSTTLIENKMNRFRVNSERSIYDIPKQEIACAMRQVMQVQGNLNKEDLFKATLEALDYKGGTLSNKNFERLDFVYNWALTEMLLNS